MIGRERIAVEIATAIGERCAGARLDRVMTTRAWPARRGQRTTRRGSQTARRPTGDPRARGGLVIFDAPIAVVIAVFIYWRNIYWRNLPKWGWGLNARCVTLLPSAVS